MVRIQGTKVTEASSSKDDLVVTVPAISTLPSLVQEAVMLEREKIPELQDVDPNLKPGQDANEVATSVDTSSQRRKKAENLEEEVVDDMVAVPILLASFFSA